MSTWPVTEPSTSSPRCRARSRCLPPRLGVPASAFRGIARRPLAAFLWSLLGTFAVPMLRHPRTQPPLHAPTVGWAGAEQLSKIWHTTR